MGGRLLLCSTPENFLQWLVVRMRSAASVAAQPAPSVCLCYSQGEYWPCLTSTTTLTTTNINITNTNTRHWPPLKGERRVM